MAGILVLGETYDGNIQSSTSELLAAADNINKSTAEVISVVFLGVVPKEAIDNAYVLVSKIEFENKYFRKDIGKKGL